MVMQRSLHHALDRDAILRALSSFYGITTADGNVAGTTLICSTLIGSNDFITDKIILLQSGDSIYENKGATAFNPLTGQITVDPAFSSQVLAGTGFYVLNQQSTAAAIASILAAIDKIQGLVYYGVVTGVPVAGQFEIASLAGLGAAKFATVVPEYQYHAFVLRDAAGGGAAPQGESQAVTNYGTATGNFTANPFTVPVDVGDEILVIHPYLARIMNLHGLPPITGSHAANWQVAEQDLVSIGAANTKYKLHSLIVGIQNLVGNITIRMYTLVAGVERRIYPIPAAATFSVAADAPALPIVNGTWGIHDVVRVTVQSDNAADNGQNVDYDYLLEAM